VVDGGISIRFSPRYPKKVIQLSDPANAIRNTQQFFYALDMRNTEFDPVNGEGGNLSRFSIEEAEGIESLRYIASTYDFSEQQDKETEFQGKGKNLLHFRYLNPSYFPLGKSGYRKFFEIGPESIERPH